VIFETICFLLTQKGKFHTILLCNNYAIFEIVLYFDVSALGQPGTIPRREGKAKRVIDKRVI
jgi:phenylacetate-coenzyme A ligase PaaK-like adenylate-forming protein